LGEHKAVGNSTYSGIPASSHGSNGEKTGTIALLFIIVTILTIVTTYLYIAKDDLTINDKISTTINHIPLSTYNNMTLRQYYRSILL